MDETASAILVERLVQLGRGLKDAGSLFDASAGDGGRIAVFAALNSVNEFATSVFADPAMLVPLRQLQYALADLDRGKTVPLLLPRKARHRPPDSLAKQSFRAIAAAAMDLLVASKIDKKEAARVVARILSSLGYRDSPGKPITGAMVAAWRDRMMSDSPGENPAVGRFRRVRQHFLDHPPADPRTAAAAMLRRTAFVSPPQNPKKPPT